MSKWTKVGLSTGAIILLVVGFALKDFLDWKALGPGGLPHNLQGWITVTRYRLAGQDPLDPSVFRGDIGQADDIATIGHLSQREGARPNIGRHPIPHRQLDRFGSAAVRESLLAAYENIVDSSEGRLLFKTSAFERHNDAIWHNLDQSREIAHVHPSDGSVHAILSPSDADVVLATGRGELHPLVGGERLGNTYTLVYAPTTVEEVEAVTQIIEAAIAYFEQQVL